MAVKITQRSTGKVGVSGGAATPPAVKKTAEEEKKTRQNTGTSASGRVTITQRNSQNTAPVPKEDISLMDRLTNMLTGAGKSTVSDYTGAAGTLYQGGQAGRSARNQEMLEEYQYNLTRAQKTMDDILAANREKPGTFGAKEIQSQQYIIDDWQRKVDALTKVQGAQVQQKATQATYDLSDSVQQKGQQDIEAAKQGLGKVGQFAVDAGVAGAQMAGDMAIGMLTGGTIAAGAGKEMVEKAIQRATSGAMAARVFGGSAGEARRSGATYGQQLAYGAGSALTAWGTEKLSSFAGPFKAYGPGLLDDVLAKVATKPLGKLAVSALSEGGEEMVEALVQPLLQNLTYNSNATNVAERMEEIKEAYDSEWLAEMLYSGAIGAVLGFGGAAVSSSTYTSGKPEVPTTQNPPTDAAPAGTLDTTEGNSMGQPENAAEGLKMAPAEAGTKAAQENRKKFKSDEEYMADLQRRKSMAQQAYDYAEGESVHHRLEDLEAIEAEEAAAKTMTREGQRASVMETAKKTLGKEGFRMFEEAFRETDDVDTSYPELIRAYNEGLVNRKTGSKVITEGQYESMFGAGRTDAAASVKAQAEVAAQEIVHGKNSGIDYSDAVTSEYVKSVDKKTVKAMDTVAKALGLKVRFADSVEGGDANAQIQNGIVTIEKNNPHPLRRLFGHEITHRMQDLAPAEYARLREVVAASGDLGGLYVKAKVDYADHGRTISNEAALDEAMADYVGALLEDSGAMDRFIRKCQNDRTLLEKLRDLVRDLARKLRNTEYDKRLRNAEEQLSKVLDAAVKQAKANANANVNVDVDANANVRNSIKSLTHAAGMEVSRTADGKVEFRIGDTVVQEVTADHIKNHSGIGALIKAAQNNGNITDADAKIQYEAAAEIMNMIINTQDPEMVWAWVGSSMFSAIKSNADGQYGTTIDFTTVCRKTQDMITAMSRAMVKMKRGLTKDEVTKLQKELIEEGSSVPCPVCYVFSRWAGIGSVLDNMYRWQNKYDGHSATQINLRIAELSEKLGKGKTKDLKKMLMEQDQEYDDLSAEKEKLQNEKRQLNAKKKAAVKDNDARALVEIQKRLDEIAGRVPQINKRLGEIKASVAPELAWLLQVRSQPDYEAHGKVSSDVLFNLDDAATFAEDFPLAWKYRTSRGPSAGKAILPYSDMRLGDMILGVGNTSADGNTLFSNVDGEFTEDQNASLAKAIARTRAQNLIGGQRFQSTSDFRYDYALDYLMAFWEAQALGSNLQTYTKIVEFADMVAAVGGDVNLSVMPRNKGYITLPDGTHQLVFSSVTGIDFEAAKQANALHDNAQLILVGINDNHILAALEDSEQTGGAYIGFVIPYHASGASINEFIRVLVSNLGETYMAKSYQDYSDVQSDKERSNATADQKRRNDLRTKLLRGKDGGKNWEPSEEDLAFIRGESVDISQRSFEDLRAVELKALRGDKAAIAEYESWTAGVLLDLYNKMWVEGGAEEGVRLNTAQAKAVMPHEYWNKTVNRDRAFINGFLFRSYCYNLGLTPRFSGAVVKGEKHGDFTGSKGYWKTLIDRPMYRNDGTYRDQQAVNVTSFQKEMLTADYAQEHWAGYSVQEPDAVRANRAADKFVGKTRFSLKDSDYMKAVKSGDVAAQERMVAVAAREAGFTTKLFHGTQTFGFTKPRTSRVEAGYKWSPFWATPSNEMAQTYSGTRTIKRVSEKPKTYHARLLTDAQIREGLSSQGNFTKVTGRENVQARVADAVQGWSDRALRQVHSHNENMGYTAFSVPYEYYQALKMEMSSGKMEKLAELFTEEKVDAVWDKNAPGYYAAKYIAGYLSTDFGRAAYVSGMGNSTKVVSQNDASVLAAAALNANSNEGNYALYANTDGMLFIDCNGAYWNSIEHKAMGEGKYKTREIAEWAKKKGYTGVVFRNVRDNGPNGKPVGIGDAYAFFHPEHQIKSADPTTYDSFGNVIPLSKRFNPKKKDIRYSLKSSSDLAQEIIRIRKEGARNKRSDAEVQASIRAAVQEAYAGMIDEYGAIDPGEMAARDVQVPKKTGKGKKVSQTVRTVMEAMATPDEVLPDIEKMVAYGEFSYDVYTDKQAIADAEAKIKNGNWVQALIDWTKQMESGVVSKENTTLGWALYNNAVNTGDTKTALTVLRYMVRHQRNAAQALQATRILKKLSPDTQLYQIQKTVEGINEELQQRYGKKTGKKSAHKAKNKEGNVPVEQWMQKTGEILAKQLGDAVTQKTGKEKTVSQRVLADLRKLAKETVKPAAKPKDTRTEMDSIYDMFNNREQYEKALNAAKETVAKEYGNKPEIMEALDQWMKTAFDYTAQFTKEFTGQTEIQIPQELADKFLSQTDQTGRDEVAREIYRYVGSQMPSRFIDKWNAWRYLAMLGNLRTHDRNIGGNAGFAPVVATKNATATFIEWAVNGVSGGKLNRTKAMVGGVAITNVFNKNKPLILGNKADRALLKAAWDDFAKVEDVIMGNAKYGEAANPNQYIEEGRKIFGNTRFKAWNATGGAVLEAARKGNTKALEVEDRWFSQPHYAAALASYCKAHNLSPEQIAKGKETTAARTYAIKEAQKATYRDTNDFSQMISNARFKNPKNNLEKAVNAVVEGIIPFRKTPANILVRGLEYSPLGLMNGIKQAAWDVKRGKKTGAEAIDSISAGLTGTGLLGLGLYLAAQGLVRGHGGDDEDQKKFEEMMGHQAYALEIGNESYTLDWLAPEALPFFIGVNLWEMTKDDKKLTLRDMISAVGTVTEPLLEMSCLQSLNAVFETVGYASSNDMSGLTTALASAATSYITQAFPTILGQAERTGEDVRMTTYTDKNKQLPDDWQYTLGKASARTPIWEHNQIPYIDAWGRKESSGGIGERAANNFLNPAYTSEIQMSAMEKELLRLYEKTGESKIFPDRAAKYFNVYNKNTDKSERKDLTANEYVRYAQKKGQTSYALLTDLTKNSTYKALESADQVDAISKCYEYANAVAKSSVSSYKPDGWVAKAINANKTTGIKPEQYVLAHIAQGDIESFKNAKGETIDNSKGLQIMAEIYKIPGLSEEQRMALADYFGVNKTVRKWNRKLLDQKLQGMKAMAK